MRAKRRPRPDPRSAPTADVPGSRIHGAAHSRKRERGAMSSQGCAIACTPNPFWVPTGPCRSVFFQGALQRMLMLPGKVHDLGHFRLGDLVGVNPTHAHPAAVDMQHDPGGLFPILAEEPLEDMNDELHRRVVVVQHEDLVHGRLLRLRLRLDDDAGGWSLTTVPFFDVAHLLSNRYGPLIQPDP